MRKIFIAAFFILFAVACNHTNDEKQNDQPADKKFDLIVVQNHIHQMNKSYGDRFTNHDTSFYNERYCKDIMIMPEQMPQITGRDSVRLFNYNGGNNKELRIVVTATGVYGGPEVVVEEGAYEFPDDKGGSLEKGKFIALWKQEDGKWKLFREIWNRDNAPDK